MKNPVTFARGLFNKLPRETIRYVIAGALTTLVDYGLFLLLTTFRVDDTTANWISIAAAVLFAYFINKLYVFKRHAGSFGELALEFIKFMAGRVLTALPEYFGYPLLLRLLGGRESIVKGVTIVVVFVLNYIISKLFVFRGKKDGVG